MRSIRASLGNGRGKKFPSQRFTVMTNFLRAGIAVMALVVAACGSTRVANNDAGAGDDAGGDCTTGDACQVDGSPGLCSAAGTCGLCADTVDDARCAAAYGAGTLCVQGQCEAATCHDSTDCPGTPCINNQCVGCQTDNDCDSTQVCNVGVCSDAVASCAAKSLGAACGAGDLCCTRGGGLSCVDVECCTDAQCGANQTCQSGACVATSSGCIAPPGPNPTYFVDTTYTGPSTGSTTCPFKSLHGALNAVRTDNFTGDSDVVVKGGAIDATSEGGAAAFPLTIPSSVSLRTQTGLPDTVVTAPANKDAFVAPFVAQAASTQNFAARISHFEIKQAAAGTAGAAVTVTGGTVAKPVHLDHLSITNFFNGINIDGGKAEIGFGVDSHGNASAGMLVAAGRVEITVGAMADARTQFRNNKVGIVVSGDPASVIVANGSEDAQGLDRIAANGNTEAGIRIFSSNAENLLSRVGANLNGNSGLSLFGGVKIKVRSSRFKQNMQSGIRVSANGLVQDVGGIDLGTDQSQGLNELGANSDADLCITADDNAAVRASGNLWGAVDCSLAAGGNVKRHASCAGVGSGVGATGSFIIPAIVSHCALQ